MPNKDIEEIFVNNLNQLLKKNNMTNKELATKLNIRASTVSMWMKRCSLPRMSVLDEIADLFHVSVSDLLEDKSTKVLRDDKTENDIGDTLERALKRLESYQDGLMFLGEPIDNTTKELLKASLENSLKIAEINAKQEADHTMPIAAHNDDADDEEQQRLMREDIDKL